jgi:hypothetical protein
MMSIDHTTIFMDHIREHAPRYYPGFESEQIRIQLLEKQERPSAMLYRFKVSNGAQIRSVFVKVPLRSLTKNHTKGSIFEKPLLFPKTEPIDMPRLHYSALSMIHNYISSLDKSQLGAIRVLDYLPQYKAVFTEESSDPSLRQLFLRENRLHSLFTHDGLSIAFQNAGTWLRMYHAMPKEEDVNIRHQHRDDYIGAITKLTEFLAKVVGDELFFKKTASIIINKGREILPESLPLGLGHGDYAMRNILIGPNARVTVLDTFAKWRTPIYEDIGYFLIALKMPNLQVLSHGLAFNSEQLSAYEHAFLKGYFEEKSIPYPPIRLFEILALLDKWSTTIAQIHHQTNFIKTIGRIKAAMISQYYKRMANKLLREIIKN